MKKGRTARLTILAVAAAIALFGIAAALVVGGSSPDSFVTLSNLRENFLPAWDAAIYQKAADGLTPLYDAAAEQLAEESGRRLGPISSREAGMTTAARFTAVPVKAGDAVELQGGASLIVTTGGVKIGAGALLDLSEGARTMAGETLTAGRRYLTDGSARVTVDVTSALGSVRVQGNYRLWPSAGRKLPFEDVAAGDWFHPAVQYAYDNYLMGGVGDTVFAPAGSMTRAMLATVLCRMEGTPAPTAAAGFTDVEAETWYTSAVDWAAEVGVVNGLGDGLFGPDRAVTREQLAVMLYRYAAYLGVAAAEEQPPTGFSDSAAVSSWATEGMGWAVRAGILAGRDTGALDPGGTATRAEVAIMLQRFAVRMALEAETGTSEGAADESAS